MITVTSAALMHARVLAELAEEMDSFYGATEMEPMKDRVTQITEALFGNPPSAYSLLAWDDERPVGFASYSFLWPAVGLTRSLYLKELYVINRARRAGVGKLLMLRLYEIAVKGGCSRVEWTTDSSNATAQSFYSELGVEVEQSKLFYRVEGDELARHVTS